MKKVIGAILAGLGIATVGAVGAGLGAVLAVILLLLKPLFAVLIGWVIGHGVALVAGNFVAGALATILHTTITASTLPQIFAGLSLLSSYIKPVINNNNGADVKVDLNDALKKARTRR